MVFGASRFQEGDTHVCSAMLAGQVLAPGIVADVDVDGSILRVDANLTIAAKDDRPDIGRVLPCLLL